jgi:alpha-mannosidase
MDDVLVRLERDPALTFHLDGQVALVDDYLAVRADARPRVARLAAAGRLSLGPWYVLADELLAGDEPLVRNLMLGRRTAAELGGWLPVGYSPDAFGHPATLPTVLSGFGIASVVLWRGYGGEPGQEGDRFRWVAPDGSAVLVHHLPPAGYEYGANLPADPGEAARRWAELRATLEPRGGAVWLILNGADHHALQPDLSQALGALRAAAPGYEFEIGTLDRYFELLGREGAGNGKGETGNGGRSFPVSRFPLPGTVTGELRWSYRYAWTLQGVHATRAGLKRAVAEGAALLTRWAEPQSALAAAGGGSDRRPLLDAAWREHLLNLSHDVLAGTVADPVAHDVAIRARQVIDRARGLLDDALLERLGQKPTVARRHRERWTPSLVVVNPSPVPRAGLVEATVTLFRDDVVVGRPPARRGSTGRAAPPPFRLLDAAGDPVPTQVLEVFPAYERLDTARDYPDQDEVWAARVIARVDQVPAFGCVRLGVEAGVPGGGRGAESDAARHSPLPAPRSAASLVSDRDEGDTYTFQPVPGDRPVQAAWGPGRTVWRGPLVAGLALPFRLGDRARGTLFVRADAGSALVRYVVDGVNLRGNHRLRIVFPAGGTRATADMPYGSVTRPRVIFDPADFPREWPALTGPMHRYVSAGGRTVFARGLHEYELLEDGRLAITLFRAVGDLSRGALRARPGHAAWPTPTPGAQELGAFRAELAVAGLGAQAGDPASAWAAVERAADEFHAPLAGRMLRWGIDVPPVTSGPELSGEGLVFKALKPRADGPGVVLRCLNPTDHRQVGRWRWPAPIRRAFRARLDETVLAEIRLGGDRRTVRFEAKPWEVVTIIIEA